MQLGFIGLGKMGSGMVKRLLDENFDVVIWNRSPEPLKEFEETKAQIAKDPVDLLGKLNSPRIIWIMVSAGEAVESVLSELLPLLQNGDLVIDGGNSFYKDSLRRAEELSGRGVDFMDVGVSGGPDGARNGACLMIGGKREDFEKVENLFKVLAAKGAYQYLGEVGAGHFAKMVHNGIEYGMMEAIAEGATLLKYSGFKYDLSKVFDVYNARSVIESRLVGWSKESFEEDGNLTEISSKINHTGEGEWTINTAKEMGIELPVIKKSFDIRVESEKDKEDSPDGFRNKVVSALRGKFGHHEVKKN